jgi:prepilin-type N-terminal cleavage/methylation domain-containing protein
MTHNKSPKQKKGFTLIELLVVIGIIAVLAVAVILTLNPTELLRQSHDAQRISDLSTLKSAIGLYLVDTAYPSLASSSFGYNACYLSTISGVANGTTTAKCGVFANTYASGDASTTSAFYRSANSTGWLPVNLAQLSYGTPLSALPVDPVNSPNYYYSYAATTTGGYYYEIDAFMESKKYGASGTNDVVSTDGGDNPHAYEVGNFPGLNL